jgi:predicted nucleotidyltransferase
MNNVDDGLTDRVRNEICSVIRSIPVIEEVILYGSRAKGNYRKGSDIDITLIGASLSLNNAVYPLMDALDELYLPYSFDISIFEHIENKALIDHILRVGKKIYKKQTKEKKC